MSSNLVAELRGFRIDLWLRGMLLDAPITHNYARLCWHRCLRTDGFAVFILTSIFLVNSILVHLCWLEHRSGSHHAAISRVIHILLTRGRYEAGLARGHCRLHLWLLLAHCVLLVWLFVSEGLLGSAHRTFARSRCHILLANVAGAHHLPLWKLVLAF